MLSLALGLWGRLLAGEQVTAVATVTAGFVTGITVTSGGSGYVGEPAVTITDGGGSGSGATAKAILTGDKVTLVVVLTAGSGYSGPPTVQIEAPPKQTGLSIRLVPALTVDGPPGSTDTVEWSLEAYGPWTAWTNVVVGTNGTVVVDLSIGASTRFYRAVARSGPPIPAGFVFVQAGTFAMGTSSLDPSFQDSPQHFVTLTQGFWISDHETTEGEWLRVMDSRYSQMGDNMPISGVGWYNAVDYCDRLTELERSAGRLSTTQTYRLPTEAEWEYACRAGNTNDPSGILDSIAWYSNNSSERAHPVGQKQPNVWGLYDTLGNVAEWVWDRYGNISTASAIDPRGPGSGTRRISRGGNWASGTSDCNASYRGGQSGITGFRPVLAAVNSKTPPTVAITYPVDQTLLRRYRGFNFFAMVETSYADGWIPFVELLANGQSISSSGSQIKGAWSSVDSPASFIGLDLPEGTYDLTARILDNDGNSYTSAPVHIVVESIPPPVFTQQPASVSVASGAKVTFSALAVGQAPGDPRGGTGYSWYFNGGLINGLAGGGTATLRVNNGNPVTAQNAGNYWAVFSDTAGSVQSTTAVLTVQ